MKMAYYRSLLCAALMGGCIFAAQSATPEESVVKVVNQYRPGTTGFEKIGVAKLDINDAKKVIKIDLNEAASYLPLTKENVASLKKDITAELGSKYKGYEVKIDVVKLRKGEEISRKSIEELALFAPKNLVTPSETNRFVTRMDAPEASKGLDGSNIAMWQSHGWYFEPKLNRWEWQRARIFQTVEDLYTQSYVLPFLMPMLENAGAYVMSPRERDVNLNEIIIDNDGGFAFEGYADNGWETTDIAGFGYVEPVLKVNENPFRNGTAKKANVTQPGKKAGNATWSAPIPEDGTYAVYVSYQTLPNSATDAHYTINALDGKHNFKVNQQMGGGTWIYLGHFPFKAGEQNGPIVELSTESGDANAVVTADAVKIGGGMGNVARKVGEPKEPIEYEYVLSEYPRFTEAAMYWLQWAGAPDSVYTPSKNVNDYTDDYRSRGEWVNWLAGGSSVLPGRKGLNIPVDLSFAFHTDAGTTMNDSIIGTLGIFCTDGHEYGENFANGMSRYASRDLTDLIMTNIVEDVRAKYEPNWTRRGMWNSSYYEARVPEVPAMLLEFLSHQNFADMKYGLDPQFRFDVSRAIYKGMLQFLAHRDGREYVVQPLPINSFSINAGKNNEYVLRWKETVDELEPTATPSYYIVQERINDGAFVQIAQVTSPEYKVKVTDKDIHSYRIVAGNDGGISFPGEVLALCNVPGAKVVNVVNGFTRISAPDWFDSGEIAGFYDARDHGVPYVQDISFIGSMFEYRRDIPWMDDDAAGFGASRANYEDKVVAGNTFDFVYTHGRAIVDAGYGFVSTSVAAYMESPLKDEPMIVDLILGKQKEIQRGRGVFGTYYKTFPAALQNKIREFTAAGGNIFVSGAFVATDLWDNPFSDEDTAKADQDFATGVLGYHWRVGQATVEGSAYEVQTRFPQFTGGVYDFSAELNEECYAAESPDSFYPADDEKGTTFMRYSENNLIAGIAHDGGKYRTVVIGFPFETIENGMMRSDLMAQVLAFLTNSAPAEKAAVTMRQKRAGNKGASSTRLIRRATDSNGRSGAPRMRSAQRLSRTADATLQPQQAKPMMKH